MLPKYCLSQHDFLLNIGTQRDFAPLKLRPFYLVELASYLELSLVKTKALFHLFTSSNAFAAALLSKSSRVVVREEQYAFLVLLPLLTTTKLSKSHFIAQAQTQSKSIKIMT